MYVSLPANCPERAKGRTELSQDFLRRTQFVHGLPFCETASQPILDFRHGSQLVPKRRRLMSINTTSQIMKRNM